MRVEAGHVYVIPPNVQMEMRGAELHLSPRPADRSRHTPIDAFLVSLAEAAQERERRRDPVGHAPATAPSGCAT